jgi:hypothetical protein
MNATTSTLSGRREETRRDRLAGAQIEREREEARACTRILEREADARARLDRAAARRAAREASRQDRALRLAAVVRWVSGHVTGILFVPVIGVPAVLSWTAMAAFGSRLYGPAGLFLPAFSEGAAWSFAAATTISLRRQPGRPVLHLRIGTAAFALFGAGLNYLHGASLQSVAGLPHGLVTGLVMAALSVAGIAAHQIITTGPRGDRHGGEAAGSTPAESGSGSRGSVGRAPGGASEPEPAGAPAGAPGAAPVTALPPAPGHRPELAIVAAHMDSTDAASVRAGALPPELQGRLELPIVPRQAPVTDVIVPKSPAWLAPDVHAVPNAPADPVFVAPPAFPGAPEIASAAGYFDAPESALVTEFPDAPDAAPVIAFPDARRRTTEPRPKRARRASPKRGKTPDPVAHFADAVRSGNLPSRRQVMRELHLGAPKADLVLAQLAAVTPDHPALAS